MAQYEGALKCFNNAKGYGIIGTEDRPDVFCHYSPIQGDGYKSLNEGNEVEYDVIQGDKGLQADKLMWLKRSRKGYRNSGMSLIHYACHGLHFDPLRSRGRHQTHILSELNRALRLAEEDILASAQTSSLKTTGRPSNRECPR